jgi:hypothetical protein
MSVYLRKAELGEHLNDSQKLITYLCNFIFIYYVLIVDTKAYISENQLFKKPPTYNVNPIVPLTQQFMKRKIKTWMHEWPSSGLENWWTVLYTKPRDFKLCSSKECSAL